MREKQPTEFHWGMEALLGGSISKEEAAQLEDHLKSNAFDFPARAALLGYYCNSQAKSKVAARNRIKHILWTVEHAPDCGLGVTPYLHISKSLDAQAYQKAKELVLLQCERFKTDATIMADLAWILCHDDPDIALQLLRKAHSNAERNEKHLIAFWLSTHLHRVGRLNNDQGKLAEAVIFMQEVVAERPPGPMFDFRFWLAQMAYDNEQFTLAAQISNDMIADNNENGQASHVAHIVLGRIAYQEGNIPSAVEHLIGAGRVNSSPRLCSYGPMMKLAQDLLEYGERDVVVQYLTDCKKFWEDGRSKIPKWIREIEAGKVPILQGDD